MIIIKKTQACRSCKYLTTEKKCPNCGSSNLSPSWKGVIVVLDIESQLAKTSNINKPGKYALYVG
ncbi:MAG: transcription elongation factor subunit Spt4 [Candidatus Aenigmarchaeota archaeon]|nr:transcription elongation factor Spt4 [Candidatus Aenigmarchaeota archaeon]MCX8190844.1 transcription elongation factor Spt4 [Candidatus Aenigmarchaeota archaeon]MDW8159846.1 transcription elongation factor subunit Spt4 [Candidatus Aenigmarchaeota archaeon]